MTNGLHLSKMRQTTVVIIYKYGTFSQFLSNPFRQAAVSSYQDYKDGTVA